MCGRYGRRVNHQERLSKEKLGRIDIYSFCNYLINI
jgi:hypothetical protein